MADDETLPPGYLPEDTYQLIRRSVPMASVDVLPWREGPDGAEVLLINRLDRLGNPCWCWVGGRVHIDEPIASAIQRHLRDTLGAGFSVDMDAVDPSRPDALVEYSRTPRDDGPYDEAQHSLGMTYLLPDGRGEIEATGEATEARWFPVNAMPPEDEFSFGQAGVIYELAARAGS